MTIIGIQTLGSVPPSNKCPDPGPARYSGFFVKSADPVSRFVQSELHHSESRSPGRRKTRYTGSGYRLRGHTGPIRTLAYNGVGPTK